MAAATLTPLSEWTSVSVRQRSNNLSCEGDKSGDTFKEDARELSASRKRREVGSVEYAGQRRHTKCWIIAASVESAVVLRLVPPRCWVMSAGACGSLREAKSKSTGTPWRLNLMTGTNASATGCLPHSRAA